MPEARRRDRRLHATVRVRHATPRAEPTHNGFPRRGCRCCVSWPPSARINRLSQNARGTKTRPQAPPDSSGSARNTAH
ncbi:hypothetical protein NDU88_009681 [Pleurodeles waltl]|uniref:Uncharacterized protein n=1 Tax=Pleurodeles waltl TaxID=8319 RepID=A0AAV7QVA8_PLEWA|nr:hypothetical protein NDU88_009681 [Pleurodeles waltl]